MVASVNPVTKLVAWIAAVFMATVAVVIVLAVRQDNKVEEEKRSSTTSTTSSTTTTVTPTTTTTPPPPTTTERPPRTTTTVRVSRGRTSPPPSSGGPPIGYQRSIGASAYCLSGNMANGERVHDGAVASTVLPRGTSWKIIEGKLAGKVLTVKDTGGPRATFDVWMASCPAAIDFGRPTLVIERVA